MPGIVQIDNALYLNLDPLAKGGSGSGNFGHSGRSGVRGGSGGGRVLGGLGVQVGIIPHYTPEKPVYQAKDAAALFDTVDRTIVVGIDGKNNGEIFYCDSSVNHSEIVRAATDGKDDVDNYVRYRVARNGLAYCSLETSGIEIDHDYGYDDDKVAALDNIYLSIDTMVRNGLPASSRITVYDYKDAGYTITAEKALL
jgi:hypothetical protein